MEHHTHSHESISNQNHSDGRMLYPWEKSCHALIDLLERKNIVAFEEKIRKWAELSVNKTIDGHAYYEYWILSVMEVLVKKGLLHHEEINRKSHEIALRSIKEICIAN